MKNVGEPFSHIPKEGPLLEIPPIAQHIKYDWGTLQVSEAAHEAYGLVPLVPNVQSGPSGKIVTNTHTGLRVDVLLLAAHESTPEMPPTPDNLVAVASQKIIDSDSIGVLIRFGSTKAEAMAKFAEMVARGEVNGVAGMPITEEGVPLTEAFERNIAQYYTHIMLEPIAETVAGYAGELITLRQRELFLSKHSALGAFSILGAGMSIYNLNLIQGRITPASIGVAGVFLVVQQALIDRYVRAFVRNRGMAAVVNAEIGRELGRTVADAIHNTYCSEILTGS